MKMLKLFLVFSLVVTANTQLLAQPEISIAKFAGNRAAAISLTFDDGIQEHFTLVAPHLDRYGLKGTFGINGKFIGDLDDSFAPRMTWEECRKMAANGHEINNHSWSHPNLYYTSPDSIKQEIEKNDSAMMAELGFISRSVLYPFNCYNDTVLAISEKGKIGSRKFQYALGQRNSGCTAESVNQWLNDVVEKGEWGITMTHGIYTAWDQWDEPQILWNFFKKLYEMSDSIWVDTFANVQEYIKERDETKISVHEDKNVFTVTLDCPLDSNLFDIPPLASFKIC